ncbi:MAG: SIS domain-containing protein [Trueperaceae bacterium]|nr:SIS domain-containing protein [Trueperaceae bacterium]
METGLADRTGVYRDNPRALVVTIQGLMPNLTPAERAIAEVVLELRNQSAGDVRLAHVAGAAGVSQAAVVKFAQRLGLQGFRDLRDILLAYRSVVGAELHEELALSDDPETVVRKVFHTATQALTDTLAIFDYGAFDRAAGALAGADQRLLVGVGGSATIARDFEHKLLRIGIPARAHDDTHLMAMTASLLEKDDVALGISHSGATVAVLEALELAAGQGATTIGITNTPESELARVVDVALLSASQGSPITGENAASRVAQLNVLDALFVRVAQVHAERSQANLEATMRSVTRKRLR